MNKTEYATWNYPLWIDNEYGLYMTKIEFLMNLECPVNSADVKTFCIDYVGEVSPDGARLSDVNFNEIAGDWELERQEWISDDQNK